MSFWNLLMFLDMSPMKSFSERRDDDAMSFRFQCIEQVVRESQRLFQSRARCRYVNQEPLKGPEVLSFFDLAAPVEVSLRLTNQPMCTRNSMAWPSGR